MINSINNKNLIKYGWWVLIIASLVLAFGVYVNNGYRFNNSSYKTNNPVCPDDFSTSEEQSIVMEKWTNNFFDTHPDATISDFSKARVNFWKENNCTEALKRYDDYTTGNVDKETQQLIEGIIAEEMLKNKESSACPNDFTSIGEEFISFSEWWEDFTANNPKASMPEMLRERRKFYVENNCMEDLAIHDEFFAGKTDKEINNLVEVELYNQKIYNLMDNEKYNEAISLADEYLKKDPKSIDMWIHKSMAYYYLEDCNNASTSIRKAQELRNYDPTNKELIEQLIIHIDSDTCKR